MTRPALPPKKKRTIRRVVLLNPAELAELERRAEEAGRTLGRWMRERLLAED